MENFIFCVVYITCIMAFFIPFICHTLLILPYHPSLPVLFNKYNGLWNLRKTFLLL